MMSNAWNETNLIDNNYVIHNLFDSTHHRTMKIRFNQYKYISVSKLCKIHVLSNAWYETILIANDSVIHNLFDYNNHDAMKIFTW